MTSMTKLFLIFLSILAGVMGGLALSNRTRARERYFEELMSLIERLISDIRFSQQPVEKILSSYQCRSAHLSKNLSEYVGFMAGEAAGSGLSLSKGVLTKREAMLVADFFARLGTLDLDTQVNELEARKEVFKQILKEASAKNRSFGKAYIKLGFLTGLLIGILII